MVLVVIPTSSVPNCEAIAEAKFPLKPEDEEVILLCHKEMKL